MKSGITAVEIYKLFALLGIIVITLYVYSKRENWLKLSQGLKPLMFGISILIVATILNLAIGTQEDIKSTLLFSTLHSSSNLSLLRMIAVAYILIVLGIEIILVLLLKGKLRGIWVSKKPK